MVRLTPKGQKKFGKRGSGRVSRKVKCVFQSFEGVVQVWYRGNLLVQLVRRLGNKGDKHDKKKSPTFLR